MAGPGPAFALAAALREPGFRAYLAKAGHVQGTYMVAVSADMSWEDAEVLSADLAGEQPSVMLARRCDTAPHGWELRLLERPTP
jgi:hypothetical protein